MRQAGNLLSQTNYKVLMNMMINPGYEDNTNKQNPDGTKDRLRIKK
jgi:hypothetical protein